MTLLLATILSWGVATTMTRPLAAVTTAMRDVAATGDLTRRVSVRSRAWDDADARLLAAAFNTLTESIGRFQREGAQKERLSSLGRLSTVIAHEIRNPLMIIRASLSTLRAGAATTEEWREAVADIDEESRRINRIVTEVLDFAKPIRFELARDQPQRRLPRVGGGSLGRRGRRQPDGRPADPRTRRAAAGRGHRLRPAAHRTGQPADQRAPRRRAGAGLGFGRRETLAL